MEGYVIYLKINNYLSFFFKKNKKKDLPPNSLMLNIQQNNEIEIICKKYEIDKN